MDYIIPKTSKIRYYFSSFEAVYCEIDVWFFSMQVCDFKAPSTERSTYLLRAVNASLHLQALVLKRKRFLERRRQGEGGSRELEESISQFAERDFHRFILENGLVPNSSTLEVCVVCTLSPSLPDLIHRPSPPSLIPGDHNGL